MIFLVLNDSIYSRGLSKYQPAPVFASQIAFDYETTFIASYDSNTVESSLESIQCPIPIQDRVKNYTGTQCVYSSIETLGRWAGEPKLINPPITSRSNCQSFSGPNPAAQVLNSLKVKFEQSYGDKKRGIELIKKAMSEGRAVLWDVPGHAMVLVHYSERENRVCWIDNSDRQLRIQETTISKFMQRWKSWVLVIYPDDESILIEKLDRNINLPIIDHTKKQNLLKYFIPFPRLD